MYLIDVKSSTSIVRHSDVTRCIASSCLVNYELYPLTSNSRESNTSCSATITLQSNKGLWAPISAQQIFTVYSSTLDLAPPPHL